MTAEPTLDAAPEFRSLDPRVVRLWRTGSALSTLLWTALAIALFAVIGVPRALWSIVLVLLAVGAISALLVIPRRYRAWKFVVDPMNVRLRHGVLWRKDSVVPHGRIQHVDTTQGPIERSLGLATVVIYTAGSVGGALSIPGLAHADAEALRDQLAALSGSDDAV